MARGTGALQIALDLSQIPPHRLYRHFPWPVGSVSFGSRMNVMVADPVHDPLKGLRVFVVEDEAAIALLVEDMLLEYGCEVVGPVARVEEACERARAEAIDIALLDVNVAGQSILPVIDILAQRSIPIVLSTGYGSGGLDERFRGRPMLEKPFTQADLGRRLLEAWPAAPRE